MPRGGNGGLDALKGSVCDGLSANMLTDKTAAK
jgi:hypothetical protein